MTPGVDDNGADLAPGGPTAPSANAGPSSGLAAGGADLAALDAPAVRTADGKPADLRSELLESGWFQGAVLPPDLVGRAQMVPGADDLPASTGGPDGPWLVVVSQDCDLVYGDCVADPVAEVALAVPVVRASPKCERLRNPRELHVPFTRADGSAQPVTIDVRNRGFVDRALLLTARPLPGIAAGAATMRWIAGLLARRYIRTARPEAFDWRFRKARRKIIDLLDAEAAVLLDVLLFLAPEQRRELTADERYAVSIYAVLQDEFADTPRAAQQKKRNAIHEALRQAMLPCKDEGIDVDLIEVTTRYDITLRDYDDLLPMDLGPP